MTPAWWMFVLVFGINFALWGAVGVLRFTDGALDRFRRLPRNAGSAAHRARRADVVVARGRQRRPGRPDPGRRGRADPHDR